MMENIRREGKLCDVNIIVGDHTLQGHRIVLAANIPYFRAMFTHDMAESRQPNITMHSIDPSAAESLINFAYTGRVTISTSNVQNLMMGASFLQLSKVRDACAEFLQVYISLTVLTAGPHCLLSPYSGQTVPTERPRHQNIRRESW